MKVVFAPVEKKSAASLLSMSPSGHVSYRKPKTYLLYICGICITLKKIKENFELKTFELG